MLLAKQICTIGAVFYVLLLLFVYLRQESFIFFPTRGHHQPPGNDTLSDYSFSHAGTTLKGWLINKKAVKNRLIIYYGGNAEDIFFSISDFKEYKDSAILLANYRGYGSSTGKPGERELFADALAILDDVTKRYSPKKTLLMGRSLGSGIATYVAAKRKTDGMILISPFDSLESLARRQFPFLPTSILLKHRFRSIDYVKHISCPSLVIYGGRDTTVPSSSTKRLLARFKTEVKTLFIKEGGHNNIEMFKEYKKAIQIFISDH